MSETRAPMDCRSPRCRHLDDSPIYFEQHDRCRIGMPFQNYCPRKQPAEPVSFYPPKSLPLA